MSILISDIAKIVGVSNATVSNALNNRKGVSDEKKKEIIKVANELGYYKKKQDDSSRIEMLIINSQKDIVGDTAFFSELIKGVEKECFDNELELVIRHIDASELKEVLSIENINEKTTGYLLLATEMLEKEILFLEKATFPFIILDASYKNPRFSCVAINNRDAAYNAGTFLINSGHKKIGLVTSEFRIENFKERETGFLDALKDHNIEFDEKFLFTVEPTLEGSYNKMNDYLRKKPELPSAMFVVNDTIAFGVNKSLIESEVRSQISIIGFDDIPIAKLMDPPLTTIKVEKKSLGKIAVNQLLSLINDEEYVPINIQVNATLIVRKSVKTI